MFGYKMVTFTMSCLGLYVVPGNILVTLYDKQKIPCCTPLVPNVKSYSPEAKLVLHITLFSSGMGCFTRNTCWT